MLIKRNQRKKMRKTKNLSLKNLIQKKKKIKKYSKSKKILRRARGIKKGKNIQLVKIITKKSQLQEVKNKMKICKVLELIIFKEYLHQTQLTITIFQKPHQLTALTNKYLTNLTKSK